MAPTLGVLGTFRFEFYEQLFRALIERARTWVSTRTLKIVRVDHDHRLIEYIMQLIPVQHGGHNRQRTATCL